MYSIKFGFSQCCILLICLSLLVGCAEEPAGLDQERIVYTISGAEAIAAEKEALANTTATIHPDFELGLWAADSLVAAPVALAFDHQGGAYFTKTDRRKSSEMDIRRHMEWATRSISFQSVEDRRTFLREEFDPANSDQNDWLPDFNGDSIHDWRDLTVETEKVFKVMDQDQDGYADYASQFVASFNEEVSDVIGGVLPHEENLYVAIAPDIWRIVDENGDGIADEKTSIAHGFGVHIGFGGHNLSGLKLGPDGKIYWGIGDIGMNVTDQVGKQWKYPNQGVICRANPDGSDFEVFAAGLRNTHEFVFDDFGNMITEDNDGDHRGERERLVYIVDGHDAGWRINWQFGKYTDPDNNTYKVWMDEKLYVPHFEGQAAFIIPPIMNYHNGPAGMVYNPGTALSPKWRNHFFLVEFVGAPSRSGIHAFRLEPKGAGFEFAGEELVMQGILATGLDFGPDGALYFSDWFEGWEPTPRGRIWKMDVAQAEKDPLRSEVADLLASDFKALDSDRLGALLAFPDQRVRMKAQFELVSRGEDGRLIFEATLTPDHDQLARIHSLWGLEQLVRNEQANPVIFSNYLEDQDQEVVAQAAKLLGECRFKPAGDALTQLLNHESDRVKFFAMQSLGKIKHQPAIEGIVDILAENNNQDVYLRHAGVLALARIDNAQIVANLAEHDSESVRLAAVVALRRMQSPLVARFLNDSNEFVVTEAARAINDDWSITEAIPALASILNETSFQNEALIRRSINANLRNGNLADLQRLVNYAIRSDVPTALREEAIATIGTWHKPSVLDRVDGRYRGVFSRSLNQNQVAFATIAKQLLDDVIPGVVAETAEVLGRLNINQFNSQLEALILYHGDPLVRSTALAALFAIDSVSTSFKTVLSQALTDKDDEVRVTGLEIIPQMTLPESESVALYEKVLENGKTSEQQAVVKAISKIDSDASLALLTGLVDQLPVGRLNLGILLELEEAIDERNNANLTQKWTQYWTALDQSDPVVQYLSALEGGNFRRGRNIFYGGEAAQCTRCHVIQGEGSDVGPALAGVASRMDRRGLLQSIVAPSAVLAPGYGVESLTLNDESKITGFKIEENATELILKVDGKLQTIAKDGIKNRITAPSSMPVMTAILSKSEIRDLVAFLVTLE